MSEAITKTYLRVMFKQVKHPRVASPVLLIMLISVALMAWRIHYSFRVRWAREQALPRISRLVDEENVGAAYALAVEAERLSLTTSCSLNCGPRSRGQVRSTPIPQAHLSSVGTTPPRTADGPSLAIHLLTGRGFRLWMHNGSSS